MAYSSLTGKGRGIDGSAGLAGAVMKSVVLPSRDDRYGTCSPFVQAARRPT